MNAEKIRSFFRNKLLETDIENETNELESIIFRLKNLPQKLNVKLCVYQVGYFICGFGYVEKDTTNENALVENSSFTSNSDNLVGEHIV